MKFKVTIANIQIKAKVYFANYDHDHIDWLKQVR